MSEEGYWDKCKSRSGGILTKYDEVKKWENIRVVLVKIVINIWKSSLRSAQVVKQADIEIDIYGK